MSDDWAGDDGAYQAPRLIRYEERICARDVYPDGTPELYYVVQYLVPCQGANEAQALVAAWQGQEGTLLARHLAERGVVQVLVVSAEAEYYWQHVDRRDPDPNPVRPDGGRYCIVPRAVAADLGCVRRWEETYTVVLPVYEYAYAEDGVQMQMVWG